MKKINKKAIILIILIGAVLIGYGSILLPGFRQLVSWEKTKFTEYEDFREVLTEYNSFGGGCFLEEIPGSASDMKCYWYIRLANKLAAYSMILSEDDYQKLSEERLAYYGERDLRSDAEETIYIFQEEEIPFIEDVELYQSRLTFIDKVLQTPGAEKQYYFLVVNRLNTADGCCYNGVILNDATHEVIEFSAQLMEEPKF